MSLDTGALESLFADYPDLILWFRPYFAQQWLDNPIQRANDAFRKALADMGTNRRFIKYVSGYNETGLFEQAASFKTFETEYARLMRAEGFKVVSYNFSVEQPGYEQIAFYAPVPGDALGLNEYQAPEVWSEQRRAERLGRHQEWRTRAGWHGDVLVGETGIDRGLLGEPLAGWRAPGHEVPPDEYAKQLRWLGQYFHDVGVTASFVFNIGTPDWQTFELSGHTQLADAMAACLPLGRQPMTGVSPVPKPPPVGGIVTFIDQAELDFMHKWQDERNANNQDPSSLNAYQAFLVSVGKDPSNPAHYGAMVATAAPPAPVYKPTVVLMRAPTPSIQGTFAAPPKGVILHGSRSGQPLTEAQEALATARYCQSGTGGNDLAWTFTCAPDLIYTHTELNEWGWNAGDASREYLAVEFAQPHLGDVISDKQVNAFAFWFATMARKRWPALPLTFLMHGDTSQGQSAGKTDVFPAGSTAAEAFRNRIKKRLKDAHGIS